MKQEDPPFKRHLFDKLWDLWCVASILGIWPRYIEPNILLTTQLTLEVEDLPEEMEGLKIFQFSDLHLNPKMGDRFLRRIVKKCRDFAPDVIIFTGDFLCFSTLPDKRRLKDFFCRLPQAPYGNFAILGNHDYDHFIGLNEAGEYDIHTTEKIRQPLIKKGFKRLFSRVEIKKTVTEAAKAARPHPELVAMLETTPFHLLHNETIQIHKGGKALNICGFGEYMGGQMNLEEAYANYDRSAPGLLLLHNPDGARLLSGMPGDIILSGHTHAGQINLPLLWQRFAVLENPQLKQGHVSYEGRSIYISRGVGATLPFRWFAPPELLFLTLKKKGPQ